MTEQAGVGTEAQSREITITRLFDAPRDLVFKAWTDAEQITRWWGPEGFSAPECESDPRPGGALRIVMRGPDGVDYPMTGAYLEVSAPQRLVVESTALRDGEAVLEATTTVDFADLNGKTEVTVHARAVALIPDAAAMMLGGMGVGWNQSLQCLDDLLTGAVDRQIVLVRLLEAPREVVFRAFTEQGQVTEWWGPTGFSLTIHEMDVRPGGTWRFIMHGPDGVDYPNTVVYEEVASPERLVWKHGGAPDEPSFRSTVTFDEFMGLTAITMRMAFETADERDAVVEKVNAIEGGNQTLDRLVEHLTKI